MVEEDDYRAVNSGHSDANGVAVHREDRLPGLSLRGGANLIANLPDDVVVNSLRPRWRGAVRVEEPGDAVLLEQLVELRHRHPERCLERLLPSRSGPLQHVEAEQRFFPGMGGQQFCGQHRVIICALDARESRVPGSGVRGRGSGERETTASSLAGKEESSRKEDNSGQGKDGPAGAIAQGGNGR